MTKPFDWTDLVCVANLTVERASRDKNAALEIVRHCTIALRDLLQHEMLPDPHVRVYLAALQSALEQVESGADATTALHLRHSGRVRDERLFGRDLSVFVEVGREFDKLTQLGRTRGDSPIATAKQVVAKRRALTQATVDRVWTRFGSAKEWANFRDLVS